MDSAVRIAIIGIIIAAMIGLIATIGIPALPEGTDELIDDFCQYLQEGRKLLNHIINPYVLNGALTCVIIISQIGNIMKFYSYIKKWFAGG